MMTSESKPIGAEIRDQALHAAASAAVISLALLCPTWWGGALTGLSLGLIRETAQHNTFRVWTLGPGSGLDVTFWTLAGAVTVQALKLLGLLP